MGVELFDPIKTASKVTNSVIVSFSGGKESLVVLDMCERYFEHVYAFHMYDIPHLSFSDEQMAWYESRYPGLEIIEVPHPNTSHNMHYGIYRHYNQDVPLIGMNDIYAYIRWLTGAHWIAAGERCSDSLVRLAMIRHSGTVDVQRGRFYPVANWNEKQIRSYIKCHGLRYGRDSRVLGHSFTGIQEPADMVMLRDRFPNDYERYASLFPGIEIEIFRHEHVTNDRTRHKRKRGRSNGREGEVPEL